MKYQFIAYPKCTTCQKAKKWLNDNDIEHEERHIKVYLIFAIFSRCDGIF